VRRINARLRLPLPPTSEDACEQSRPCPARTGKIVPGRLPRREPSPGGRDGDQPRGGHASASRGRAAGDSGSRPRGGVPGASAAVAATAPVTRTAPGRWRRIYASGSGCAAALAGPAARHRAVGQPQDSRTEFARPRRRARLRRRPLRQDKLSASGPAWRPADAGAGTARRGPRRSRRAWWPRPAHRIGAARPQDLPRVAQVGRLVAPLDLEEGPRPARRRHPRPDNSGHGRVHVRPTRASTCPPAPPPRRCRSRPRCTTPTAS